jgi:DNA-binding GntR family transcriptional regulator
MTTIKNDGGTDEEPDAGWAESDQETEPLQLERVYQQIKWRVVYGTYAPGKALSESVLARVHGSSRTPVREALARLVEEGYVDRVPRKGWIVSPITLMAIQNTFDVRRLLEGTAAEIAAQRADAGAIAKLRSLAEYPTFETTTESYRTRLTANAQFHLAVATATQNGFLVDLVRRCLTQHNRVLSLGLDFPVHPGSVHEHHEVVNAIERHDPPGAKAAMEHHLGGAHRLVMDFLMRGRIRGIGL